MNLTDFNKFHQNNLDKLSKENYTVFLLGDFNINLLNYDQDTSTNKFLDSLLFLENRAEYKNGGNNIMGLQTNRICCHINGLKTQQILIASLIFRHHQIFQAFEGFSGSFNKHG